MVRVEEALMQSPQMTVTKRYRNINQTKVHKAIELMIDNGQTAASSRADVSCFIIFLHIDLS